MVIPNIVNNGKLFESLIKEILFFHKFWVIHIVVLETA